MRLLIVIAFIVSISAAPEIIPIRCFESSFCRRARTVDETAKFTIERSTVTPTPTGITGELKNAVTGAHLVLKLNCLESNTFHFEIDEKTPLRPRFRVKDTVVESIKTKAAEVSEIEANRVIVSCDTNKAKVVFNPFHIDFLDENDEDILSVNSNELMTFEQLTNKPSPPPTDGSWDETFEGYTDSKPNGPEAVALDFTFHHSEVLFGIPEHHDTFALRKTVGKEPYRLYTLDVTFYDLNSRMPNYGAIPVMYGHGPKGTAGIFWHNSADTYIDIHDTENAHFISEGGIIDVFVFLGPKPNDAFSQYTKITGVGNLPPLYTLGFHQSRWNYKTQQETLEVVQNFDKNDIPLDTIWLDIEYTDGKRYFTWNTTAFPTPLTLHSNITDTGRHLVVIIDPHIKIDDDYFFYRENKDRGYFVRTREDTIFEGACWPGNSSYVNFFNDDARSYYADQYLLPEIPTFGIWNDMNEPVVFNAPEKTFPRDAVHVQKDNSTLEHRYLHNMYALMQTKGTFEGLIKKGNGDIRPFILTRAFFAGNQKYSAVWTGDNQANWGHLLASVQVCLAISVAGISFCGADIGGFFGEPNDELYVRWTQAAAFQPFFRNHASDGTLHREPYLERFSEDTRRRSKEAIINRYKFLPLWYTLFYEHEITGHPIMRPMLSEYPLDKNGYKIENQFMLGNVLLVHPVVEEGVSSVDVYFPSTDGADKGDIWYDVIDYTKIEHVGKKSINVTMESIPVYQRGGTILAKKLTPRRSSAHMREDPVSIFVALDVDEHASGTLYEDDGETYAYRKEGKYEYIDLQYHDNELTSSDKNGKKYSKLWVDKIFFAGVKESKTSATFTCKKDNHVHTFEITKYNDNVFYVEVSEDDDKCEDMDWTLVLNGSAKNIINGSLLLIITMVNLIKYYF